jgi:hypothetical protein
VGLEWKAFIGFSVIGGTVDRVYCGVCVLGF